MKKKKKELENWIESNRIATRAKFHANQIQSKESGKREREKRNEKKNTAAHMYVFAETLFLFSKFAKQFSIQIYVFFPALHMYFSSFARHCFR